MSWLQRKWANLQGTLKVHVRFYNRISRLQRRINGTWHALYSFHIARVTYERLPPHLLTWVCTFYVYKPVDAVASTSLFLDIQVLRFLWRGFTLFAHANLCCPTTRPCSYFFSTNICSTRVYRHKMGFKRSLKHHNSSIL